MMTLQNSICVDLFELTQRETEVMTNITKFLDTLELSSKQRVLQRILYEFDEIEKRERALKFAEKLLALPANEIEIAFADELLTSRDETLCKATHDFTKLINAKLNFPSFEEQKLLSHKELYELYSNASTLKILIMWDLVMISGDQDRSGAITIYNVARKFIFRCYGISVLADA